MLQVDTALRDAADDLPDEIALKGRGGTDFRPGFEWLDEQGIQPTVCLYFTDMECCSYPETEPSFSTIWVNWGPGSIGVEPGALGRAHRHRRLTSGGRPAFGAQSSQLTDFHGEIAAHEPCIPLESRMNRAIPCAGPPYAQGFPQTLWST